VLTLHVAILIVLLAIAQQDFRSRSVYLFWFVGLLALVVLLKTFTNGWVNDACAAVLINLGFLFLQLLLLTVYFSIKNRGFVLITDSLLGWGDVLLLCCIAFYLSVLNFIFFYLFSLLITLVAWAMYLALTKKNGKHIPLAGLQGIVLVLFLSADWFFKIIDLTSDNWLLHFIT
jgi:hypothetical protein